MADVKFDLLGHPIPDGRGKAGRTGHVPTPELASHIRVLLVANLSLDRIAAEVGLSVPTIRKHYFANGKVNRRHAREMALSEARAKNLLQLQAQADKGNVSAMKELRKIIAAEEFKMLDDEVTRGKGKARAAQPAGKKATAREAALEAERELGDLIERDTRIN